MMRSLPADKTHICIKSRKNRDFHLHLKPDICSFELFKFPNNVWVEGINMQRGKESGKYYGREISK